jgi:hypothetical protein
MSSKKHGNDKESADNSEIRQREGHGTDAKDAWIGIRVTTD